MYGIVAGLLCAPLALAARWATSRLASRSVGLASFIGITLLTTAIAAVLVPDGPHLIASMGLAAFLTVLAAVDVADMRLPDVVTLPLILLGLAEAALLDPENLAARAIGAVGGYVSLAMIAAAYRRARGREGLGLGDAKLLAAAGAWLGWRLLPETVLIAAVGGLVWAMMARVRKASSLHAPLPFGPFIAAATWICWLAAPHA